MSRSYGEGEWIATYKDGHILAAGSQYHCHAAIGAEVMMQREEGVMSINPQDFTMTAVPPPRSMK